MKQYTVPDKSEWPADDPRQGVEGYDDEALRKIYNDWMPREQPPCVEIIHPENFPFYEQGIAKAVAAVGGTALDIGCGNGRLLIQLIKGGLVKRGLGIDVSDAMVENARKTAINNNLDCFQAGFMRCSIENAVFIMKFDVIIATELLEHIFRLRAALRRIVLLLKNDGVFVGTTPQGHVCDAVVHLHYFTPESLTGLLLDYFGDVVVQPLDYTGEKEMHLVFICHKPRRTDE